MTQLEINELLSSTNIAISTIERDLVIPQGALNKAKNGVRDLPKKFITPLRDYLSKNGVDVPSVKSPIENPIKSSDQPIKDRIKTIKNVVLEKPNNVVVNEHQKNESEKLKALKLTMDKIDKDYGKGTVRTLGDNPLEECESISTGSISLNRALGVGGIPRGRITEIYGMESSGKTTLTLHVIKEAQKIGLTCAFIDVEHAFDVNYAEAIGVDTDSLVFSQPDNAEQALEVADRLASSGAVGVIILDSVAALVSKSELEGESGDFKMGMIARLLGQSCRKITAPVGRNKVAFIFINQLRVDINIKMGNPNVPCGGKSLKFFSSVRLDVSKSNIKDGEEIIGSSVKIKVVKNKVAPPFRIANFNIFYGEGIDRLGEILDIGVECNIIQQGGAWFTYKEHKFQGREKFIDFLASHDIIADEIESAIYGQSTDNIPVFAPDTSEQ